MTVKVPTALGLRMGKSVSIGELHVPGSAQLHGARTFVLTVPALPGGRVELLFGLLAADAPKKVAERLCDRMTEDLRPVFFSPKAAPADAADPDEARFEVALKQANRCILGFLYEHRLSLPGIRLRGALAALIGNRLLIASRGGMRGLLFLPQDGAFAPYTLIEETPDRASDPKFFSSLQSGVLPPGARLIVSTSELFGALDEAHVRAVCTQDDAQRVNRDLKTALKNSHEPVTILMLTVPGPVGEPAAAARATAVPKKNQKPPEARPRVQDGPDLGQWIARAVAGSARTAFAALRGIPASAAVVGRLFVSVGRAAGQLPSSISGLASADRRAEVLRALVSLPDRAASAAIERLNAVPAQSRLHLLLLLTLVPLLTHGLVYSTKRQLIIGEVRAYETSLTEIQGLQTDLDASLAYGNDARSRELIARLEALISALPIETANQKQAKSELAAAAEERRARLRKEVRIKAPAPLADFADASGAFLSAPLAVRKERVYVFSASSPSVRSIGPDGAVAESELPEGAVAMAAANARTGILLLLADGRIALWNPEDGTLQRFEGESFAATTPILFYQNRLYAAKDGRVDRRPLQASGLGVPAPAAAGLGNANLTGLAADGALYALASNGNISKYLRGGPVPDFSAPAIDPHTNDAFGLWASVDSQKLIFAERTGRIFIADKKSGALIAQLRVNGLTGLAGFTVDDRGENAYVLSGGALRRIPLQNYNLR